MEENKDIFLNRFRQSLKAGNFIKLSLGKCSPKNAELKNLYVREVMIKDQKMLSFLYRYFRKDITKNFENEEAISLLTAFMGKQFMSGHLFTEEGELEIQFNRKRKARLIEHKKQQSKPQKSLEHDHQKQRLIPEESPFLYNLGITSLQGKVRHEWNDKYIQINQYIEILAPKLTKLPDNKPIRIYDMGSGKGYLTFALYEYLQRNGKDVYMIGVEIRRDLVEQCNAIAQQLAFDKLSFEEGSIQDHELKDADVLIALHACDTATDEAIYKGIKANASLIFCSPCCHKQIRKQITARDPIIQFGILKERQAEMITDTIRALIMEAHGYKTHIQEFIASEHTPKNILIGGERLETRDSRGEGKEETRSEKLETPGFLEQVEELKKRFGISYHALERLLAE